MTVTETISQPDNPTSEDSNSKYCGARKRQGTGNCTRPAGWGTTHAGQGTCKLHGGAARSHQTKADRLNAIAAVQTFGLPRTVDPRQALLEEVHRTAGHVEWLRIQVASLSEEAVGWGVTESSVSDKEGRSVKQEARAHIWVELYQKERRHLVDVCKAAISAGIEERRVRVAEQQGELLAGAIRAILGELSLTPEQAARVPEVVPRHLRSIRAYAETDESEGS